MEPTSLIDDAAEFRLPPEFLTDGDFLVEKENKLFKGDESNLFPYELSHGFGLDSGFGYIGGEEESNLTGLTRKTVRSSLEDDFSGRLCDNHTKAWGATRSSLCGAGDGYGRRNHNCQASAWDLYCAAVEELAMMNISDEAYGYNNRSGRGALDFPRKRLHVAAAKIPNDGSGYYSRQSLQYQKLQALKFQQLQLMQQSRGLKSNNNDKIAGHTSAAWSNQPQRRDGSAMRAVFLNGNSRSTGTGVFLPRRVNHTDETHEKPTLATVLVPARVAEVLNLDKSVVQPSVRSSASRLNEASWRQISGFSSQMKMEHGVNEPTLPSDWAY